GGDCESRTSASLSRRGAYEPGRRCVAHGQVQGCDQVLQRCEERRAGRQTFGSDVAGTAWFGPQLMAASSAGKGSEEVAGIARTGGRELSRIAGDHRDVAARKSAG